MFKVYPIFAVLVLSVLLFACGQHRQSAKPKVEKVTLSVIRKGPVKKVVIAEADLRALRNRLDTLLSLYDQLSPFIDVYPDSVRLPRAVADTLLAQNPSEEKGKIDSHAVIAYYQEQIDTTVIQIVNHPAAARYTIGDILPALVSDDGRLANFGIPENTGGSYKSALSWTIYRTRANKLICFKPGQLAENEKFEKVFNTDGYYNIYTIKTPKRTKYLMLGSVQGCNTCVAHYADLISFSADTPQKEFTYIINTRESWNGETEQGISYNEKKQRLTANYLTSDMMPVCSCTDNEDSGGSDEYDANDKRSWHEKYDKPCQCVFQFTGNTFVLRQARKAGARQ